VLGLRRYSPYSVFLAGVLVSSLRLPCGFGPYFLVIGLLSEKAISVEGLMLLALYNAIVVASFLAITLSVWRFSSGTTGVTPWLSESKRWLKLFTGSIMVLLSLVLITA